MEDTLLDLLIMAYVFGNDNVCRTLKEEKKVDTDKMNESVYKKIKGETWVDRLNKAETLDETKRIFVTECHRVFNEGQYDSALGRATHKKWVTMEDDKVRDTHWYIEGLNIKMDEYFYTLDGDRALRPYGFEYAENNINCRCCLEYSKKE